MWTLIGLYVPRYDLGLVWCLTVSGFDYFFIYFFLVCWAGVEKNSHFYYNIGLLLFLIWYQMAELNEMFYVSSKNNHELLNNPGKKIVSFRKKLYF